MQTVSKSPTPNGRAWPGDRWPSRSHASGARQEEGGPAGVVQARSAPAPRDHIDAKVWERHDMRVYLARRDIGSVYRLLQRFGMSQRAIAARTGQSQSEVSDIVAGHRQVISYEVLERIALGLGIPRGWMGLAYDHRAPAGDTTGLRWAR
jgi:Helix-turn-helix